MYRAYLLILIKLRYYRVDKEFKGLDAVEDGADEVVDGSLVVGGSVVAHTVGYD